MSGLISKSVTRRAIKNLSFSESFDGTGSGYMPPKSVYKLPPKILNYEAIRPWESGDLNVPTIGGIVPQTTSDGSGTDATYTDAINENSSIFSYTTLPTTSSGAYVAGHVTGNSLPVYRVSFNFDGLSFLLRWRDVATLNQLRIFVNGRPISSGVDITGLNPNQPRKVDITWATRAKRKIEIEGYNFFFNGIHAYVTDDPRGAFSEKIPQALFLGDSFTDGTQTVYHGTSFPYWWGQLLGWNVWHSGVGGTGYLVDGGGGGGKVTLEDRIASDVGDIETELNTRGATLDYVVVAMGVNDWSGINGGTFTLAQFETAIENSLNLISQYAPNAVKIVLAPWRLNPAYDGNAVMDSMRDSAQTVAADRGAYFWDVENLFDGTDYATADGNRFNKSHSDDAHPNDEGHEHIGVEGAGATLDFINLS